MAKLRAGAAMTVLTPPLGTEMIGFFQIRLAEDVHDELHARAFVFESDDTQIALVVCDLIALEIRDVAAIRRRAEALTGIPAANILVACTHSHYVPATTSIFNTTRDEEYTAWAVRRIADAVKLAWNRLEPARVGHASGMCPEETHNRRYRMKDGTVRMNPGYLNPDIVSPAGPIDPEVGLLAVEGAAGGVIGALGNYPLHYVGGPYATTISADYFGAFGEALQRMAGERFVAAMANGCCGDINNIDPTRPAPEYPHPFYQMERVGQVVASRAFGAWRQVREFHYEPKLGVAATTMTFRRRHPSEEELAEHQKLLDAGPDPENRDWVYANEAMEVAKLPLEEELEIQALAIGDLGIVALPGEIFVEYGLAIKRRSPFARTFVVELGNGWIGYCPTDRALAEGSYETRLARSACAAEGTERAMIDAAVEALQQAHAQVAD
ncbi:MAG: neutral/alkaline non-lysosomal ceramidase N-terminal domain-containing protein [Armatimonadetes bacterium]|nr:neutral/alkaline non-lysosomal ceramidase N-terminal domain-containing protein [Armatimonadota bacterium]